MSIGEETFRFRLIFYFLLSLGLYFGLLKFTVPNYQFQLVDLLILTSIFYLFIFIMLWRKERQIYKKLRAQVSVPLKQKIELVVCPNCQVLQKLGKDHCVTCKAEWNICQVCKIPFNDGESVVITPCCGQGFHVDHFQSSVREKGHCPSCKSLEVVNETNW